MPQDDIHPRIAQLARLVQNLPKGVHHLIVRKGQGAGEVRWEAIDTDQAGTYTDGKSQSQESRR